MVDSHEQARLLLAARNELGEGPSWDAAAAELLWVDIDRNEMHRYDFAGARHDVARATTAVTVIVPRRAGGYVLTLEDAIAIVDDWGDEPVIMTRVGHDPDRIRMNDGKCDTRGRLWAGSMARDATPGAGALYRADPDGSLHEMLADVSISNGLGWSPDDTKMYYVDTGRQAIDVFDFDVEAGSIHDRRTLVEIPTEVGLPDGLAVDSDGCIWLALWGGHAVRRYGPEGAPLDVIELPTPQVTSCVFGGRDLRDLYITSAGKELDDGPDRSQELDGGLFTVRVSTPGLPTNSFAG